MARKPSKRKAKNPPAEFGGVLTKLDGMTVELTGNREDGSQHIHVRQPLGKDWLCVYSVANEAGVPVVSELRIFPRPPSPDAALVEHERFAAMPIPASGVPTQRALRKVKPEAALAAAREALGLVNTFDIGVDDALEYVLRVLISVTWTHLRAGSGISSDSGGSPGSPQSLRGSFRREEQPAT